MVMTSSPIKVQNSLSNMPLNTWPIFAEYDENAKRQRLQIWIMVLGVIATALAFSDTQFRNFFLVNSFEHQQKPKQ